MKFLYATDLHGNTKKYESLLTYAIDHGIKYIHIGADILPKGSGIFEIQKKFVKKYLLEFYLRCEREGIQVFSMFGNDDLWNLKDIFRKYGSLLDDEPEEVEGFTLTGYPFVPDYPFGLVTACKYDYDGWNPEPYYAAKVDVDSKGFVDIPDKYEYFKYKGTIKEDLDKLHVPKDTIIAIHCPPCSLGMDICSDGRAVGSKSIYEWVDREQPRLVLCGHIHESRYMTGTWKAKIGDTVVLQPGQYGGSTYAVLVTLDIIDKSNDSYVSVIL